MPCVFQGIFCVILLVHCGKRDYPYQSYLRLSLRHGFSRNPEGFAVHVYMGHDLRHDALVLMPLETLL